jgi:ubiquinone/menaquinone biosynthesis C-methylase UbiE
VEETSRIRKAYIKRQAEGKKEALALFNDGDLFIYQQRERELIKLLKRLKSDLYSIKILEVGSGTGFILRELVKYGANPKNLYGVELLDFQLKESIIRAPHICCIRADGGTIPFKNESFDMVWQFTAFTSILNPDLKKQVAKEMMRVLNPGGFIIWYDFFYDNPSNPNVKGVKNKEIVSLFPNCTFNFTLTTLAPPLARTIAPYSWLLCYLLEKIPILRTHYLVTIQKNNKGT